MIIILLEIIKQPSIYLLATKKLTSKHMNNRARSVVVGVFSVLAIFVVASVAFSAVTTFKGQGTFEVDSLKVGNQGTGGVTAFNGTIINNTTGANGSDQPVAFGDNVRIDGRVYRGSTAGTSDDKPFIINDNAEISGTLEVNGKTVTGTKRYEGTIDTGNDGDFISTYDYDTDCTTPDSGTWAKQSHAHFKKITVTEASMDAPINIRVFYKPYDDGNDYSPSIYPENNDVWVSAGYSLGEDAVYLIYKYVEESCNGTLTDSINTTGAYQVVVN